MSDNPTKPKRTSKYFTELQPKDGQTVLHCEHVAVGGPGHFFTLGDGAPFTRPDGSKAKWKF